ncbi:sugar nucleotide-binding protein [Gilvimarinus sp. F26214L]|uniref:sugar nucleotide-binding protein n=1 Tax=Gilvimarinus sp. DZF01 TaxID=3461371 RepID=UPI004045A2B2
MVAFANKRVLVTGPANGLVAAIAEELEAGNTTVDFVQENEINWDEPSAVDALFASHPPAVLLTGVDVEDPVLRGGDLARQDLLLQRHHMLAFRCAQYGCIPFYLSDYHVFGGDTKNAYDEADPAAPLDSYGEFLAELEQKYARAVEKHLILRFSWLIDADGDNLFTRILTGLCSDDPVTLSPYRRGAPTWHSDARRVVCGVLRQVLSGAENWGYFHYSSADSCNEWEFGQEVAATLSELQDVPGSVQAEDDKDRETIPQEPASASLNSRRIRNNFGVHGRSWRQGLKAQVSRWLDRQAEADQARSA